MPDRCSRASDAASVTAAGVDAVSVNPRTRVATVSVADVGDRAERYAWAIEVAQQLATLPDAQQSALRLVYTHGLPFSEAAAWLGLRREDFDTLISTALRRLGARLQSVSD